MEMLGDVELPAEEMERIKSWVTFLASVENKNDETNNNSSAEDPENTSESSKAKKGRSGNRAVQSGKTQEDK